MLAYSNVHGSPAVIVFLVVFIAFPFAYVVIGAMLGWHDKPKVRMRDERAGFVYTQWDRRNRDRGRSK